MAPIKKTIFAIIAGIVLLILKSNKLNMKMVPTPALIPINTALDVLRKPKIANNKGTEIIGIYDPHIRKVISSILFVLKAKK